MSRFYTIIGITVLILAGLVLSSLSNPLKLTLILTVLVALVAILAIGAYWIRSQLYVRTICKGDPDRKEIAITFDDGPDPGSTPEILKILQKYDAKVSFFLIGKNAEANEAIVRDIYNAGHTIGNHSYAHSNLFPVQSVRSISEEIEKTSRILERITSSKVKYFRPPFGVTNPRIYRGLQGSALKVIGWNLRSLDTSIRDPDSIVQRISKRLKAGDIILLHDSTDHIAGILEQVLNISREKGLKCVSLDTFLEN